MVADPGKYTGNGATPPTITPPSVPASAPLTLTSTFTLGAGGILYFTSAPGITQDGVQPLTNSGLIVVIPPSSDYGASGIVDGEENPTIHSFVNTATGVLSVLATTGTSEGYDSGSNPVAIQNAGVIQAVALDGDAVGSDDYGGYSGATFANTSTGLVAVWASGVGFGLDYYQSGVSFSNAGLIQVTAGTAIGVEGANAFTNSGAIIASDIVSDGGSVGVDISEGATFYGGSGVFINSGLVQADTAFQFDTSGDSPPYAGNITLNNSGQIVGAVDLSTNSADSNVINTGTIDGAVSFGSGDNTFSGATGTQTGGIYLGAGSNKVTLGDNGETVFGDPTGGTDDITGGSGNDFIEIFNGNNSINGGRGFNTLSFAGADDGVKVDLATGVATGVGTDQIANIDCVIGSTYFRNILIAGSKNAELFAGDAKDTLEGGTGNDVLVAGAGGDVMSGGGGSNKFVYAAGDHRLVITDYRQNGDDDTLHIYGYAKAERIAQIGATTVIVLSATDRIVLEDTLATALDTASIVFSLKGRFLTPVPSDPPPVLAAPAAASPHPLVVAMAGFARTTAASEPRIEGSGMLAHPLLATP
jgi:Ca2+-binding RTX toxin-like protein